MSQPPIMQVLKDAQLAHQAGDFVHALKFYQQFFDHALDDDPYALYGVRLSYCLEGWGKLAKEFVGAKNELERYQQQTFQDFTVTNKPELFHDYYCISLVLEQREIAVQAFLNINEEDHAKAKPLIKFIWDDLVKLQHWQVCNQFLTEPVQKLDESFEIFDQAVRLQDVDASFATSAFEEHILSTLVDSVKQLILVLRHNDRREDVEMIERKFFEIASSKQHSSLDQLIQAKGSFLFAGH